jgi:hypothetical protein
MSTYINSLFISNYPAGWYSLAEGEAGLLMDGIIMCPIVGRRIDLNIFWVIKE